MSQFYLPKQESEWLKSQGEGYLLKLELKAIKAGYGSLPKLRRVRDELAEENEAQRLRIAELEASRDELADSLFDWTMAADRAGVPDELEDLPEEAFGFVSQRAERAEATVERLKRQLRGDHPDPDSPEWYPWVKTPIGRCVDHGMELTNGSWHMHPHCKREKY